MHLATLWIMQMGSFLEFLCCFEEGLESSTRRQRGIRFSSVVPGNLLLVGQVALVIPLGNWWFTLGTDSFGTGYSEPFSMPINTPFPIFHPNKTLLLSTLWLFPPPPLKSTNILRSEGDNYGPHVLQLTARSTSEPELVPSTINIMI